MHKSVFQLSFYLFFSLEVYILRVRYTFQVNVKGTWEITDPHCLYGYVNSKKNQHILYLVTIGHIVFATNSHHGIGKRNNCADHNHSVHDVPKIP